MAEVKRYYYKAKEGKGYLNLKSPLSAKELEKYDEITAEEFERLTYVEPHVLTEKEIAINEKRERIAYLKSELARTDYLAIKYAEGWFSEADYADIKLGRQQIRDEINELELQTENN